MKGSQGDIEPYKGSMGYVGSILGLEISYASGALVWALPFVNGLRTMGTCFEGGDEDSEF